MKFVAVGNDKLYGLEANGTTTGTVNIFDNINLENPQSYTTEGKVGVVDGKNTIAVDGTNLYVCQGDGGLVRYDANGHGTVLFDAPVGESNKIIGRVNGVAVDSNTSMLHVAVTVSLYWTRPRLRVRMLLPVAVPSMMARRATTLLTT